MGEYSAGEFASSGCICEHSNPGSNSSGAHDSDADSRDLHSLVCSASNLLSLAVGDLFGKELSHTIAYMGNLREKSGIEPLIASKITLVDIVEMSFSLP